MAAFDYSGVVPEVREDLTEAHGKVWRMLAQPGNWWRAEDRIAIAQESRNARSCELCRTRKSALSPYGGEGVHDASTNLPAAAIDAVHRITTDPARIKKAWIDDLGESGISHGHYVELLGIVVALISIDGFHRAMGLPRRRCPSPLLASLITICPVARGITGLSSPRSCLRICRPVKLIYMGAPPRQAM